jgi:hypothetical protein
MVGQRKQVPRQREALIVAGHERPWCFAVEAISSAYVDSCSRHVPSRVNAWNKELRQHVSAVLRSKGWEPLHGDDPLTTASSTAEHSDKTDNTDQSDQLDDEALDEVGVDEGGLE